MWPPPVVDTDYTRFRIGRSAVLCLLSRKVADLTSLRSFVGHNKTAALWQAQSIGSRLLPVVPCKERTLRQRGDTIAAVSRRSCMRIQGRLWMQGLGWWAPWQWRVRVQVGPRGWPLGSSL